ncbi:MAG: type II toxin-antitoxin system RelE/ParE family toxin [Bacteroidota bacterium]
MGKYRIYIKPTAVKELKKIPKRDVSKIIDKIRSLSSNPRPPGFEKLSTDEKYRIRQGRYRIVYSVEDGKLVILVIKIGHRKDVYR